LNCPVDNTVLTISDRQGVEIDFCPQCRGVWLDRGELDKLLELGARHSAPAPVAAPAMDPRRRPDFDDSDFGKRHGSYRRKSWLSDIFD
jgi:Zn-finger nucleic acid-binding protein